MPLLDLRIYSDYYCGILVIRYIANLHEGKQFSVTEAHSRGENLPIILHKFEGLILLWFVLTKMIVATLF